MSKRTFSSPKVFESLEFRFVDIMTVLQYILGFLQVRRPNLLGWCSFWVPPRIADIHGFGLVAHVGVVALFAQVRVVVTGDFHLIVIAIPEHVGPMLILFSKLIDNIIVRNVPQICGHEILEIVLRVD